MTYLLFRINPLTPWSTYMQHNFGDVLYHEFEQINNCAIRETAVTSRVRTNARCQQLGGQNKPMARLDQLGHRTVPPILRFYANINYLIHVLWSNVRRDGKREAKYGGIDFPVKIVFLKEWRNGLLQSVGLQRFWSVKITCSASVRLYVLLLRSSLLSECY